MAPGHQSQGQTKFVVTTESNNDLTLAQDLLQRNFTPEVPHSLLAGYTTYIAIYKGWRYQTVAIGLFGSQEVAGACGSIYIGWKDCELLSAAIRPIYTAASSEAA